MASHGLVPHAPMRVAPGVPRGRLGPASPRAGLVHEVVLVAGAMLLYFVIRNITAGNATRAFANARALLDLEQWLGLAWEGAAQGAVIGHERLVDAANWVYIWGHWPVILPVAVVLYLVRRHDYLLMRNAFFLSGAVGFLLFALLPVAPPRLLDLGLVDTVTSQSHAYRTLQPPGLTNQYAAFPSLHFGWNVLVGIALYDAFRSRVVKALAVTLPVLMGIAVVVTANHFVVDVVAGGLLVLLARLVVRRMDAASTPSRRDEHTRSHPETTATLG